MIVDDEPITARGYARALTSAGYKVTVARAGREGAALARSKRFDVIVSDIAMPDMDGLALLRDIRQSDLDVPMIFMTGSPALETAMEAIEYGAFRYLLKPVPLESLLEVVNRAVAVHKLARVRREASAAQGAGGEADRRSRRAWRRGSRRRSTSCGWPRSRSCRGRGGASSRTRRCCGRTSRRCAARSTSSTPPSGWGRPPSSAASSARHVAALLAGTRPAGHVFVNLHPADLEDRELYADDGALTPYASQVVLEITERAALDGSTS